jgi:uncharacterized membrane protein
MNRKLRALTQGAVIAAAYVILTVPLAQIAFGPIQFRLAEALSVLAALTPAAVPGLFIGCLLANLLNPQNLGPIDILGGSLATLLSAWLTWRIKCRLTVAPPGKRRGRLLVILAPAVLVNALVVGFYLPWIIPDLEPGFALIAATMGSILLSQSVVVYLIGLPFYLALRKIWPNLEETSR